MRLIRLKSILPIALAILILISSYEIFIIRQFTAANKYTLTTRTPTAAPTIQLLKGGHPLLHETEHNSTNSLISQHSISMDDISDPYHILTEYNIQLKANKIARAFFTQYQNKFDWCNPGLEQGFIATQQSAKGMLFVRVPKAASSTISSALNRLTIKGVGGKNGNIAMECAKKLQHVSAGMNPFRNRDANESFLVGNVRDPAKRTLSRMWFTQFSRFDDQPPDTWVISTILNDDGDPQYGVLSKGRGGFQLKYLSLDSIEEYSAWSPNATDPLLVIDPDLVERNVEKILNDYDFLIVAERLDESLVAIKFLLDVSINNILYTSSKVSGSGFHYIKGYNICRPLKKFEMTDSLRVFFNSNRWRVLNYGDYLLHEAANRSLDMTIERIGRDRFAIDLAEFRRELALVHEHCTSEGKVILPCSDEGVVQFEASKLNCYNKDMGCGHACIDDMVPTLERNRKSTAQ